MVVFDYPPEHPFSYIQIIGYLGMMLGVFAFSQKDDARLKALMVCMTLVLVVHFSLLGSYVAAVSSCLAGSRAGLSLVPFVMRRRHWFAALFVVLTCGLSAYTYTRWIDVFPFFTAIFGTFAFFYLRGVRMRMAFVAIGSLWLTHNVLAQSYGPAVMEVFIMSANLVTIYRLRRDAKSRPV
ncbi:MAG: YgjV family protein [Alphaproteobacteria bacterium]